jgi:beta-glucosidase
METPERKIQKDLTAHEELVTGLLERMTLEEKIGQLTQLFFVFIPDTSTPEERIRRGEAGAFLFVTTAAEANRLQRIAVEESRLGIPLLLGFDVIHGFRTIFPVPLAMASSWDPQLVEQAQTVAAREARAVGIRWVFGPMVDIARDPRWGRIVEGAGEDPFLGAAMARAQVRGFQGQGAGDPERLMACVKHFAGYGAADGGRDYDSAYIPEASLRNTYLPPFHAAVEEGVGSVMSAYMDLNDVPASGNRFLLEEVLRQEWGFQGFVMSDAFAVRDLATHGFARDPVDAAARALTAGVDIDTGTRTYLDNLGTAVREARVPLGAVDQAVRRVLMAKARLGLFENPYVDETLAERVLGAREHRQAAREAARRSAVLLRNEGRLLPLDRNAISSIAVIGPLADAAKDIMGSWSFCADPAEAVTVLAGIRAKVPAGVQVEHARGGEIRRRFPSLFDAMFPPLPLTPLTEEEIDEEIRQAVELARRSDVAVVVLGERETMSGEAASRSSLALPGKQQQLLEAVAVTGKPVVLVLINGRPLDLAWADEHVPAILEAWYPGSEGGNAVADLLFGDANPGGKLPVTWPRSTGQVPIYHAHNLTHEPETAEGLKSRYWDIPSSPLYPFGFGLSYTTLAFSNLRLGKSEVRLGETLEIVADVENTGGRAGDVVAQLYIHQRAGSASRPVRELKGFERIALAQGEKRTVRFALGPKERSFWSTQEQRWVEEPEAFDVWVGEDSAAALHGKFRVVS